MSRRKMSKVSLEDLIVLVKRTAEEIDEGIALVLQENEVESKKVAIDLLLFNNATEEIYMRLIQMDGKNRPSVYQYLESLQATNFITDDVYQAIVKIRVLRNRIAHSFDILDSVFYVFSKNLHGLRKMIQLRERLKLIVSDIEENHCYLVAA